MDIQALREAGRRLLQHLGGRSLRGQRLLGRGAAGDKTYAFDRQAETVVLEHLGSLGEPLEVLTEEAGVLRLHGPGGLRVLLDPVDGSRNAAAGLPFYGSSIAVAEGERLADVFMAYVLNLASGDEFWAQRGRGAFLNGAPIRCTGDERLRVAAFEAADTARDIPRIMPVLEAFHRVRCMGAVALELACLAGGGLTAVLSPSPSRSFDYAAGWLLLKEAGGLFTDFRGQDLGAERLGLKGGSVFVASANEAVHRRLLELLGG